MAETRVPTKGKTSKPKPSEPTITISAWQQDPGAQNQPVGGQLVERPTPKLGTAPFPLNIENPKNEPLAKIYSPGTPEFRYWAAADALRRGADFWGGLMHTDWEVGKSLPVDLDHGVDFNAYYDRIGLRFFHGTVGGRTIYSGESPDILCHELGHAILDSFKPQLWDAAIIEGAAFHESFGDMSALLSGLQLSSLRHAVFSETEGMLYKSSSLSRLAEQLGWAIRQMAPDAVDPDCLRNAVNSFFYQDPDQLPTSGPANVLSSEPHSFSRVFTGAFLEGLAGMFNGAQPKDEVNLLHVSLDIGRILVQAISEASIVPAFFSQIAANMVSVADKQFSKTSYAQALKSAFIKHGIFSPAAATALMQPAMATAAAAGGSKELPRLQLAVSEYGLGIDSITVFAASEPKRFDIAGASLATGSIVPPTNEQAAKSFVEDLLRRGRLKVSGIAPKSAEITSASAPETHETYTHELRKENGQIVLRRLRVDCGCHSSHR